MRWDNLFEDLEGQLEHELSAEELDIRAEEERLRLSRLLLRDRLFAVHESHPDEAVTLTLADGLVLRVRPRTFGRDWFSADLVDESARAGQGIVPIAAIGSLALEKSQVAPSLGATLEQAITGSLAARLSLAFVLRDLCRRRAALDLRTPTGVVHGTIDRVGRDHLDLAEHAAGEPRRDAAVMRVRIIPLAQVLLVRP